jgi:hypothetical protein
MLQTRLSVAGARLYGTTNPGPASHYLWTDYLGNALLRELGLLWSDTFTLEDNLTLSNEYKNKLRAQYAPGSIFWQRFIEGKWVSAEGAIYANVWNDDVFFDDESAPQNLDSRYNAHYVAVDYGTVNQQASLQIIDDGTTLWITKELLHDSRKAGFQKTDAQYADDLIAWMHPDSQVILDPSAASYEAELRSRGISVRSADNEVLDGIRVTSTALCRRLVRIHRHNCPTLCEQMPVYQWDNDAALKGKEQPLKINDHSCFVSGTMIETPTGKRRVEDIIAGDEVLTPLGRCKVIANQPRLDECISVGLIEGTPEHPVYYGNRWLRLDSVNFEETCGSKKSATRALHSDGTQTLSVSPTATTSAHTHATCTTGFQAFIARCGEMLMGLFPMAITSTTKTETLATTTYLTSNAYRCGIISPVTPREDLSIRTNGLSCRIKQRNGIAPQMGSHGTEVMGMQSLRQSRVEERNNSIARTAVSSLKLFLLGSLSTALTRASRLPGVNLAWTMSPKLARCVAGILSRTNMQSPNTVAGHAQRNTGVKTVYSLKTEHGCYIANGLLVSNCDALRYAAKTRLTGYRLAA